MKKIFFAFVALAAIVLTACEGPAGPPGEGMYWDIQNFTVNSNEWQRYGDPDGSNTYYVCEKRYPALSNYVYTDGMAHGYIILNPGQKDMEALQPLEASYHRENAEGQRWTETYSFDYFPGYVAFYVQYSDFAIEQPPTQQFRIVLNW